jgi:hypothetical protein
MAVRWRLPKLNLNQQLFWKRAFAARYGHRTAATAAAAVAALLLIVCMLLTVQDTGGASGTLRHQ